MRTRLTFVDQPTAQVFADSIHTRMFAASLDYRRSSLAGRTLAWAIPYLDPDDLQWSVNVKDRCSRVLTAPERGQIVNGVLP